MDFKEGFNQIFNSGKADGEMESAIVEYLNSADFSSAEVVEICLSHSKKIIAGIEQNKPITAFDAKVLYCMLAKIELQKLGLPQVKVNFVERKAEGDTAGAFYNPATDSVNFYNSNVANVLDLLKPCFKGDGNGGSLPYPERRLDYLADELFKMEHEIEHAKQWKKMREATANPEKTTGPVYLQLRQHFARLISYNSWSKYQFGDAKNEDIYKKNHDEFIYEIEADKMGLVRVKSLLSELNPTMFRVGYGKYEREKLEQKTQQLENYDKIVWNHSTNPNNGMVSANYKASMMIDATMSFAMQHPQLLEQIFRDYPFVSLTHNPDGSKKSLEQIQTEFSQKIAEADNGSLEGFNKVANLKTLYETVVESDAVLSFERCLENAFSVSAKTEEYTTKGGMKVKSSKFSSKYAIYVARKKLEELAGYIETEDVKRIEKILKDYEMKVKEAQYDERRVDTSTLTKAEQLEHRNEMQLYLDKLDLFRWVGFSLHGNRDYRGVKTAENEKLSAEREKLRKANEVLQTVFPGFTPQPVYYEFNETGSAPIETDNITEKFIIAKSFEQFRASYVRIFDKLNPEEKIPLDTIRRAIETVYNFQLKPGEVAKLEEQLKNGDLELIPNMCSQKIKPQDSTAGKK